MRCEIISTATPRERRRSTYLEQPLGRRLGERARGLVEDQQPRGRGDGARDLDLLLELDAQLADGTALVDAHVEAVEHRARVGSQLGPVDAPQAPARQAADEDVLRDAERRGERRAPG